MLSVIDALGFREPLTRRGDARKNRSDLPRNKLADFVHLRHTSQHTSAYVQHRKKRSDLPRNKLLQILCTSW